MNEMLAKQKAEFKDLGLDLNMNSDDEDDPELKELNK